MLSFFPRDVLDEIWDLIESVSGGFSTYSWLSVDSHSYQQHLLMSIIQEKDIIFKFEIQT